MNGLCVAYFEMIRLSHLVPLVLLGSHSITPCQQQCPVRAIETANLLPQLLQLRNTRQLQAWLGLRGSAGPAPVLGLCSSPVKTCCPEELMELEVSLGPSSATALLLDHRQVPSFCGRV